MLYSFVAEPLPILGQSGAFDPSRGRGAPHMDAAGAASDRTSRPSIGLGPLQSAHLAARGGLCRFGDLVARYAEKKCRRVDRPQQSGQYPQRARSTRPSHRPLPPRPPTKARQRPNSPQPRRRAPSPGRGRGGHASLRPRLKSRAESRRNLPQAGQTPSSGKTRSPRPSTTTDAPSNWPRISPWSTAIWARP